MNAYIYDTKINEEKGDGTRPSTPGKWEVAENTPSKGKINSIDGCDILKHEWIRDLTQIWKKQGGVLGEFDC